MAELNSTAQHAQRRGVRRSGRLSLAFGRRTSGSPGLSTRVDLTPMVDLGFLLITFFMVSTTWSKPKASILRMPADGPPTTLGQNAALTLVALKENKIFYYNGDLDQSLKEGSYGVTGYRQNEGIGDVIRRKQQAMDRSYKGGRTSSRNDNSGKTLFAASLLRWSGGFICPPMLHKADSRPGHSQTIVQ